MAVDQNVTPPAPETSRGSAIENEIPAYRAISPPAVLSLIAGLLGLLSFANWFFLVFAAVAVVLGLYADRRIRRDPEIWTGGGLAKAGTALGLVFGLAAVTLSLVQGFLRSQEAARFAKQYAEVLKTGKEEDVYWYTVNPIAREGKSPGEMLKKVKEQARHPQEMEMMMGGALKIKKLLDENKGSDIHFSRVEATGMDGVNPYATALLEVHSPGEKGGAEREEFALLLLEAASHEGKYRWYVKEARFPYTPATYVPEPKPVDDGHGHGPGGH